MDVILKRNFHTNIGQFRSKGKEPVYLPDVLIDSLPSDAVVVGEPKTAKRGRPRKEQKPKQDEE